MAVTGKSFGSADMDRAERAFGRAQGGVRRVSIVLSDDSGNIQRHQVEGFEGELRNDIQRINMHGLSTMPLPGAVGIVLYQGGNPGLGTIIGIEDPRYRPKGLKPGEFILSCVSGADANGDGGTAHPIIKGDVDGNGRLAGVQVLLGDGNTTNVTVVASGAVTVTAPEVTIANGGAVQPVKLADGSNSTVLKAQ